MDNENCEYLDLKTFHFMDGYFERTKLREEIDKLFENHLKINEPFCIPPELMKQLEKQNTEEALNRIKLEKIHEKNINNNNDFVIINNEENYYRKKILLKLFMNILMWL